MPKIITVWAPKGGVGKTTLAYEIAYTLGAVLVDLEWDDGGARVQWGLREPEPFERARLLRGFRSGQPPRPLRAERRPDLVPGHPDLEEELPPPEHLAELISKWAVAWQRPYVVIDTHPGSGRAGRGALAVADLVVVPTLLRTKELNALAGAVVEYHDFPLLVVPNMVPPVPPAKELQRLTSIVREAGVPVGPPVRFHPWWTRRQIPSAISGYPDGAVPAAVYEAWHQLQRLTQEVQRHAG
jgi:chromosome partitioning protein